MANPIGNLGTIPTLTVANRVFTDLTTLIILHGPVSTAGRWSGMRISNGTAARQTTSAKTLTMYALALVSAAATGNAVANVLYGDTDVGLNAAAAPTNPVYMAGTSTTTDYPLQGAAAASGAYLQKAEIACAFQVPASKYPTVQVASSNGVVNAFCYEV